jgi:nitrate/nitrite transport system substrate-binding protein
MTVKSLNDPFSSKADLRHGAKCGCSACASSSGIREESSLQSSDEMMERAIESAIVRSVFGHSDISRRSFMGLVGGGAAAAALASVFPIDKAKAALLDTLGKPEKTDLNIGFVPITCATPIIMAQPLGFYERYGLNAQVIKTAGWAVARDKSLAGEYDASHMLTPMPLAMTLGAGSVAEPYIMPAVENINGQAIVLHERAQGQARSEAVEGLHLRRAVRILDAQLPAALLRGRARPRPRCQDIQIRVVPPPEMVANLRAGNLDGYLSPDPFNQRAVWENIGFIHILTKEHLGGSSLLRLRLLRCRLPPNCPTPTARCSSRSSTPRSTRQNPDNRKEISAAIAPTNYLNQPVPVVEQVLTGTLRGRAGQGPGRARPHRFRPVPLALDGRVDPHPDEALGLYRGRRRLQGGGRAGLSRLRCARS